jgi:simple sugar transport system substrate-binding protein
VVGNWYDADKAAGLAEDMIRGGCAVLLCIAGGANEGVLQAASEEGAKALWFDTTGYALRPGVVVGSSVIHQDKAAYELTKRYLAGELRFGDSEMLGVAEGYVDFITNDPDYIKAVPEKIREKQAALIEKIRSGVLVLGR